MYLGATADLPAKRALPLAEVIAFVEAVVVCSSVTTPIGSISPDTYTRPLKELLAIEGLPAIEIYISG